MFWTKVDTSVIFGEIKEFLLILCKASMLDYAP